MKFGQPIQGITYWGGARLYGRGDKFGVDLADLLALQRYEALSAMVQEAGYKPGIKARIVFEDLGRRFMGDDTPEMQDRVNTYFSELKALIQISTDHVEIISESDLIASRKLPAAALKAFGENTSRAGKSTDFFTLAVKAEKIIYDYLIKSEQKEFFAPLFSHDTEGFARIGKLKEFLDLENMGFKGGIPRDQRTYVRQRTLLRLGNPENISAAELDRHVAKYFAQGFARSLLGCRAGDFTPPGEQLPLTALSYSFLPYPPGTPSSMDRCRVEMVAVVGKHKSETPCWGGCGVVYGKGPNATFSIVPPTEAVKYRKFNFIVKDALDHSISVSGALAN